MTEEIGKSTLKVVRKFRFSGGIAKIEILLDGNTIGEIANKAERVFQVDAGMHEITLRTALPYKTKVHPAGLVDNLYLVAGETKVIECGYNNSLTSIFNFWAGLFTQNQSIQTQLQKTNHDFLFLNKD